MSEVLSASIKGHVRRPAPRGPAAYYVDPPDEAEIVDLGGEVVIRLDADDICEMWERERTQLEQVDLEVMLRGYCGEDLDASSKGDGFTVWRWDVAKIERPPDGGLVVTFTPEDADIS